jgi:hypothetical protein
MKNILTAIIVLFAIFAKSQECNMYIPDREGAKLTQTNYNAKGKVESVQTLLVKQVSVIPQGKKVDIHSVVKNVKSNEEPIDIDYIMWCKNGEFYIDLKRFVSGEYLANIDVQVTSDDMGYPANMSVGQQLDDGSVSIAMGASGGPSTITMTVRITNRRVTAEEDVTTSAGTFHCYKIEYDINTKMVMSIKAKGAEWIAKDVGVIKTEAYNKKGKLTSYSLLTKIE